MGDHIEGGTLPKTVTGLFDKSISVSYEPKEDITTYELALIIGYFHNGFMNSRYLSHISMRSSQWKDIPDNVKRHFSINGHF